MAADDQEWPNRVLGASVLLCLAMLAFWAGS
jgi:hypothetical protein